MQMPRQTSTHCRYHGILYLRYEGICVFVHILCLCYDLLQKLSALVVGLFYLKFLHWISLFILWFYIFVIFFFSSLSCVAYFSNTGTRAPTSAGCVRFLSAWREMRFGHVACVWVIVMGFILIHRSPPPKKKMSSSSSSIELFDSGRWPVGFVRPPYLVRRAVDTSLGSSAFTSTTLLPMASKVYLRWTKILFLPLVLASPRTRIKF